MKPIKPGDTVQIIDVSHSGPVDAMREMIGKTYVVSKYFDEYEETFIVGGFIFHPSDLIIVEKVKLPKGGLFNIENLILKD